MKKDARLQLYAEDDNWLNRGRVCLMDNLLQSLPLVVEGPVLDLGAGTGHAIPVLSRYGDVDAIEVAIESRAKLEQRPVRDIFTEPAPRTRISRRYGLIVGLEVLEHIEDDVATLLWLAEHLAPGGVLLLTVPAYQWLFSQHDIANEHYRRYSRMSIVNKIPAELDVLRSGYFIATLFPAALLARALWEIRNRLFDSGGRKSALKKQSSKLPPFMDWLFGKILQLEASLIRKGGPLPFGLTAYVVARRR